jgi:hypothetical protein
MALIECPECGREVSDSAAACPECAYPVATGTPSVPPRAIDIATKRSWWPAADIIGRVALGGFLLFLTAAEQELGAGTGLLGLIVAGSALPTWYRHKMERLRAGWADSAMVHGLEDRMVEVEHRHQEQIADLEERMEFTERLLTKPQEQIGSDPSA